ncbi:MBL fold metallo-hydrolase [Aeromicrobium sp. 50.2.37]|uniref:MBL fold metallo-hydrolase n=1 Tax=Aeromicrobium sp. 50.2.37 TaxID=2969305 RepID=UPI0021503C94|nr:MBL fold metallo-hydrolase [Aeromicrobium sp. 50.2.37]MCR4512386.1 MBL fold metallo-hydrolase [Aeromicrobium sp. 50.2.37]
MHLRLLGTGSADGWPNAFCQCVSCEAQRASGVLRGQTSALLRVDGTAVLLDPGPEVLAAATRCGESLADVRVVLVTHAHADHFGPQLLLFRSWVSDEPLDVVGPAAVVEEARRWVAPDSTVRFHAVDAGGVLELGADRRGAEVRGGGETFRVQVLPAAHSVMAPGDAVLYDVTGPDGARVLWACDTGPWETSWFETVRDAAYDAVLVEETFGDRADLGSGHLHLATLGSLLERLREVGAVTTSTEVVAVHLSHHNPSEDELVRRLAELGARPGRDGERWSRPVAGPRSAPGARL